MHEYAIAGGDPDAAPCIPATPSSRSGRPDDRSPLDPVALAEVKRSIADSPQTAILRRKANAADHDQIRLASRAGSLAMYSEALACRRTEGRAKTAVGGLLEHSAETRLRPKVVSPTATSTSLTASAKMRDTDQAASAGPRRTVPVSS